MIPKKIYQTHKSIEYVMDNDRLFDCYKSWDVDSYEHIFYNDQQVDDFMKTNFSDIYEVYHNLPLPVMKADLWRYCVIYHYGGIYADMDTIFIGDDLDSLFQKELPTRCKSMSMGFRGT
jgi:mannosyltransferase OCH1-like enzyme